MTRRVGWVGLLLFGSGACALVYQTVWLRQFRLIFGASTPASAAVLAIFMGGLGFGGLSIGRRVDRSRNPLAFYGALEIGVAISSAITPLLLWIVRHLYLATGGSFTLGLVIATTLRLILSTLVLAVPTVLMGGTLPAASRAVESAADTGRLGVSILYASNTVGAVAGTLVSTFYLLETFGNVKTLIAGALLNALVGLSALMYSNAIRPKSARGKITGDEIESGSGIRDSGFGDAADPEFRIPNPKFVYGAAFGTGFAFFLMELVWYRMLTPLLGGTTYTFGLILAVGLLGIGAGSFAYALVERSRATVGAFAILCALEALALAIPFALGDRLAFAALLLRQLGAIGFSGFAIGWMAITAVMIFPAAFIAGAQFPMLISLLGEGREDVGHDVGSAYLWNTAGAIAGSIAGGFGFMPLLTAPGAWRAAVVVLGIVVAAAIVMTRRAWFAIASAATLALAIALLFATGPTAFWRHSPIGAGRADMVKPTHNRLLDFARTQQRGTIWEADGIESSVSIFASDGYAFVVNGKSDGHARLDAGTQIMNGLLPALLHPNPKRAVVIGLGTGSTAGWLAAVPSIDRVDVVEIEPSIRHVAEMCTPINHDFMRSPKGHVMIGDGREFLLAHGEKYDIISSEPSNPYRAGIANLFTAGFYRACAARLNRGGIVAQFLQAYEVDAPTVRTIYATITSVFPYVETWQSAAGDLLLVGSLDPIVHRWDDVERKLRVEPYHSGIRDAWAVTDAAGVFARYVCGNDSARLLAAGAHLNTDDRTIVEYAFARTLGQPELFSVNDLRAFGRSHADDVPAEIRTVPAAANIEPERLTIGIEHESTIDLSNLPPEVRTRGVAALQYMQGNYGDVWLVWQGERTPPRTPLEMITYAEALAERGDESAMKFIDALRPEFPVEANVLLARLRWRENRAGESVAFLSSAFEQYRRTPWPVTMVMRRALSFTVEIAADPRFASVGQPLYEALREPFSIDMLNEQRMSALLFVAERLSNGACTPAVVDALRMYEPHVPWEAIYLRKRAQCYAETGDPRLADAQRAVAQFDQYEKKSLEAPLK